jgi:hypothetical protein
MTIFGHPATVAVAIYSLGHPVPRASIGFGSHFSRIVDRQPQNRVLMSCLILSKIGGGGPFVEWGKCLKQFRENCERIVPVFYGFCIISNSGHSC